MAFNFSKRRMKKIYVWKIGTNTPTFIYARALCIMLFHHVEECDFVSKRTSHAIYFKIVYEIDYTKYSYE